MLRRLAFVPLNAEYFTKLRCLGMKNKLLVREAFQVKNQGEVMIDEFECALQSDISLQSLPPLLHEVCLYASF